MSGEPSESTTPAEPAWHRLHPATPLFRGGIVVLAVLGWIVAQARDFFVHVFAGGLIGSPGMPTGPEDPVDRWLIANVAIALAILAAVLIAILLGGWLSWRLHEYRVTEEIVEEREGILRRKHRRARLDRVQGVDVVRPLVPRLFGAARLEVSVAGNDGNIRLSYLRSADADRLKAEILTAAARLKVVEPVETTGPRLAAAPSAGPGSFLDRRITELTSPELDDRLAAPASIVRIPAGRLIGATLLDTVLPAFWVAVAFIIPIALTGELEILFAMIPAVLGLGSFVVRRVTRSLRYSIAATPGGIRIGFGLLSTTNETLPPGRIHAIEVTQPLLWRPFGWWSIRINRASISSRDGAAGQRNTTILPVGDRPDVERVVALIAPTVAPLVAPALERRVETDGPAFTTSPRRAAWLRWFSWRRNGFALLETAVLLRKGWLWRTLTIVPSARVQSVALGSGPLGRAVRLARVEVHTVAGLVRPSIGALDEADAERLWRAAEANALRAIAEEAA